MNLLVLMTTGMSLRKWSDLGQLTRELSYYDKLSLRIGSICFYSYGLSEVNFIENYKRFKIISRHANVPKMKNKIKTIFLYLWNTFNLIAQWRVLKSIDIIKTNQFEGALWGVILKFIFKQKLVIRMGFYYSHIKKISQKRALIEKISFSVADSIIVTNKNAKEYITRRYGISNDKINVIQNYIDINVFYPEMRDKQYDLIYVGRLERQKNILNLLKAVSEIKDEELKMLIVGRGSLVEEVMDIAHAESVDLDYLPKVDNSLLHSYYNSSKIFILPSIYEGNPKTLLEAMACGLPVIGTNVPGIKEIIKKRINGYLCEPNVKSIKEAIIHLLNNNELCESMGINARKYTVDNHSLNSVLNKEVNIYKSLISGEK